MKIFLSALLLPSIFYSVFSQEFKKEKTCLTNHERELIFSRIEKNEQILRRQGVLPDKNKRVLATKPNFTWPIKQSNEYKYKSVWTYNFGVDHGNTKDYNGGKRTYRGHKGTDIGLFPFGWKQLERGQGEVVAVADGVVVGIDDGNEDRYCRNGVSNSWNAVYVSHSDGSRIWYGHLKKGSIVVSKGQNITQGQVLGKVGSSGNSSGPHLHIEVYDSNRKLIDPFAGSNNKLNSESWWKNQIPYKNPGVNAILTHSDYPSGDVTCSDEGTASTTETTNEKNKFRLGEQIVVGLYLREPKINTSFNVKIYDAKGTVVSEKNQNIRYDSDFGWQTFFSMLTNASSEQGVWSAKLTYMGDVSEHKFVVGRGSLGVEEVKKLDDTVIYPNPVTDKINFITNNNSITNVTIYDLLGKEVLKEKSKTPIKNISVESLDAGVYFVKIKTDTNKEKTVKFIKR